MVEINPRPHKPNLFVQVSVAVISGAAAMYCIQSLQPSAVSPAPAALKAAPAAEASEPQPPRPAAAALAPGAEAPRSKAPPPAAVSMLIAPEPGGAPGDVVSIGEDEPAPAAAAPAAVIAAAASPPQATPVIHLQRSGLHGAYTDHVGHDFQSPQLSPRSFAKKAAPKAPPPEAAPKTIPHFITSPRSLDDTGIPQKDVFVPSSLHPEIVPETVFWDYEHKRKAVIAGLIALTGVLYLMFVMGVFNALVAKPRDDS